MYQRPIENWSVAAEVLISLSPVKTLSCSHHGVKNSVKQKHDVISSGIQKILLNPTDQNAPVQVKINFNPPFKNQSHQVSCFIGITYKTVLFQILTHLPCLPCQNSSFSPVSHAPHWHRHRQYLQVRLGLWVQKPESQRLRSLYRLGLWVYKPGA